MRKLKFVKAYLEVDESDVAKLLLKKMNGERFINNYNENTSICTQKTRIRALKNKIREDYFFELGKLDSVCFYDYVK
jgi:hypothetical protein